MKNSFSNNRTRNFRYVKSFRVTLLFLFLFLSFAIYIQRLFSMQILEGSEYREQSIVVAKRSNTIPAQRGEILDREGILPLVVNTDTFSVELTPAEIPSGYYDTVSARLAQYLGISKRDIDNQVPPKLRKSYTAISILSQVPFSVVSNIAENKYNLPGVSWRLIPIRNYISTNSISHILGYVGNITQEELNRLYNQGYNRNSIIGKM
ncbi:MAG: penicillin-binding protein 2, partial [Treponema sp.]|nr:penicillin-binding protein 2 [Treponema sp.]